MSALPWWVKWVVLPVVALFLIVSLVTWLVGMLIHAVFYLIVGAAILGALYWSGRRIKGALFGNRRRRRELSRSRTQPTAAPGSPDYLREFRDLL